MKTTLSFKLLISLRLKSTVVNMGCLTISEITFKEDLSYNNQKRNFEIVITNSYKGWDFRAVIMIPCNYKLVSLFAKSLNEPLRD